MRVERPIKTTFYSCVLSEKWEKTLDSIFNSIWHMVKMWSRHEKGRSLIVHPDGVVIYVYVTRVAIKWNYCRISVVWRQMETLANIKEYICNFQFFIMVKKTERWIKWFPADILITLFVLHYTGMRKFPE